MPDALPLTGLFGKVPAHGDFVRRGLPSSFVTPWDAWLAAGIAAARESLGAQWTRAWDEAPAWRFALPPGACGPDAVAGVMLPSQDQVGRRFPITLAVILPPADATPGADWFDAVEAAALAGRAGLADADALAAAVPLPGTALPGLPFLLPRPPAPAAAAAQPANAWAPATAPGASAPDAPGPAEDVFALLAGASPAPSDPPPGEPQDDVLALLSRAGPADPPALAPALADDGTLAGLIGAAGPPASDPPPPAEADALLALIDAGAPPAGAETADLLPESVSMAWPPPAEPAAADPPSDPTAPAPPAEAPPAPEGGGWWTRGGAQVPPMVWPLAGLPASGEFAYLLEAAE